MVSFIARFAFKDKELFVLNPDQDQNMTHPTFNKSLVNSALTKILWSQFAQLSVQQDIRARDNVGRIRWRSLLKLSFLRCSTRREKVHIRFTFTTENIQFGLAKGASWPITCATLTIVQISLIRHQTLYWGADGFNMWI